MERSKRILPMTAVLFVVGAGGLSRFSQGVRAVDVVGLSGAGCAIGVGAILLLLALSGRLKP